MKLPPHCLLAFTLAACAGTARADNFGSGANAFAVQFVTIGNPGNADDSSSGGGAYFSPYGAVTYTFRMGITEVEKEWIDKAKNLGLTNVDAAVWAGGQPAAALTWYEAAAFVNWLNTSTGHQPAYNLTFNTTWSMTLWGSASAWQLDGENLYRHRDAFYFIPNETEWYKSAFHANGGADGIYFDYTTASDDIPVDVASGTADGTAVYQGGVVGPALVNASGGLSAYGTRGQGGNVWEWTESAADGANTSATELRVRRGGSFTDAEVSLRATSRLPLGPADSGNNIGFRVASIVIPEPGSAALLAGGVCLLGARRRRSVSSG